MYLYLKTKPVFPSITREIENITNYAKLEAKNIFWDREKKEVRIELRRRKITGYKRKLFRSVQYPIYDKEFVKSMVIIKNVVAFELINRDLESEEFDLLFGLTISNEEIYFNSAQEYHGDVLLEGTIKIENLDIEIIDL
jgi:hypothetical protein